MSKSVMEVAWAIAARLEAQPAAAKPTERGRRANG